jgi:hypothetical protein
MLHNGCAIRKKPELVWTERAAIIAQQFLRRSNAPARILHRTVKTEKKLQLNMTSAVGKLKT